MLSSLARNHRSLPGLISFRFHQAIQQQIDHIFPVCHLIFPLLSLRSYYHFAIHLFYYRQKKTPGNKSKCPFFRTLRVQNVVIRIKFLVELMAIYAILNGYNDSIVRINFLHSLTAISAPF